MLERLLELFLHAKSGVFAGILLIGTTGALVTATVTTSGNVTTITLTTASASPSASASASASPSASASRSPSASPTHSPSSSPSNATTTTTTCTPDSNANTAVKTVDSAFSTFHTDLMHLRTDNKGDAGKTVVANADKLLKQIRQQAVKAIHASAHCKTDAKESDDEDTAEHDNDTADTDDEDQDDDKADKSSRKSEGNLLVLFFNNLFGKHGTTVTTNSATPTPTAGTNTTTTTFLATGDAKTIADNAVAAMKVVFDSAKADLAKLTTSAATPRPAKSPEHSDKKSDHKGKGNSDDREDDDD